MPNNHKTDVQKLLRELERQNFRYRFNGKHYVVFPPDKTKGVITMSASPSDRYGVTNMIRDLRKAGFQG